MAIDTWEKLINLPNPDFRVLIEANPRAEYVCGSNWTSEGSNTYSHACVEIEVNRVTDDNQDCVEKSSLVEVQATAGSFWFDKANQKLYVHAFDNDDLSSSATIVIIMVFVWKHFSTDACEFNGIQYMPIVRRNSIPNLETEVDDIIEGTFKFNFGGFTLDNPNRWWDDAAVAYNWSDCRMLTKVGGEDLPYSEYVLYGVGYVSDYVVKDETASFAMRDVRAFTVDTLPIQKYNKTDYPNLAEEDVGMSIPLFYGRKDNISPVCINPSVSVGGRWKLAASRTIKQIRAVRLGKKTLDPASEYTQYLAVAEFELDVAYDGEDIQVDADGFVEGTDLIVKASPMAKDLLKTYAGYTDNDLDLPSFMTAANKRTQELCIYLDEETSTREVLETIGRSVVGFFVPVEEGKLAFETYEDEIPSGVLEFYDRDFYPDWKVKKDDKYVRNKVRVRFDRNPTNQEFKAAEKTDLSVLYKYGVRKTLNIETYLKREDEAKDLAEAILGMCKQPVTLVETSVGVRGFSLHPTRKIKISRNRAVSLTGSWDKKVFRARSIGKNMGVEQTHLSAMDDLEMVTKICHVCVTCQACNTCETHVSCATCDTCESCNVCEICNTVQDCTGCDVCDTCQSCNTCQQCVACQASCQTCQDCYNCEVCDTPCDACDTCESCYVCQICDVCDSCQSCNTCQVAYSCAKCDTCQTCVATQDCTVCDVCDSCQSCNTCQATCETCESCVTCESCQTCQQCVDCQTCDVCDGCQNCVSCQVDYSCVKCDTCETCVAAQDCTVCDVCNVCQNCNTCQGTCETCESCVSCESCQTCQSCYDCQTCDVCDTCQVAYSCAKCDTCQTCVATQDCTGCDVCDTCQSSVSCVTCNTCQVCNTVQDCTVCDVCTTCQSNVSCVTCNVCQVCVSGCQDCQACAVCDACETQVTCNQCDTCQSCVSTCQSCVSCYNCNTCQSCYNCYNCVGCVGCDSCYYCQACDVCDVKEEP